MFYRVSKSLTYALAAVSLAALGTAAMADVLVTSSNGAAARSYPRGTRLADNATIVLTRGDSMIVLTSTGTRRLRGPGRYNLGAARQTASVDVRQGGRSVARSGVSRGPTGLELPPAPGLWQSDIARSGAICSVAGHPPQFWRADPSQPATLTITRVGDGAHAEVSFAADQRIQVWPAGLVVQVDAEYRLNWAGAIAPTRVTLKPLAVDASDRVALGAALAAHDCDSQFDTLIAQTEAQDAGPGG